MIQSAAPVAALLPDVLATLGNLTPADRWDALRDETLPFVKAQVVGGSVIRLYIDRPITGMSERIIAEQLLPQVGDMLTDLHQSLGGPGFPACVIVVPDLPAGTLPTSHRMAVYVTGLVIA